MSGKKRESGGFGGSGGFSAEEMTLVKDEETFAIISSIIICIIFGIFAGFWGKANVGGCIKDSEKNSMVGITAAACAIAGLRAIGLLVVKFGGDSIVKSMVPKTL